MILKIDNLTPEELASLADFLASEANVIQEHMEEGQPIMYDGCHRAPKFFATLQSSRHVDSSHSGHGDPTHNVTLVLQESHLVFQRERGGLLKVTDQAPLRANVFVALLHSVSRFTR